MEGFCKEIVEDIKNATNEAELIKVISNSMPMLRKEQNSFNDLAYIINMLASLRSIDTADLSTDAISNIKLAIAIFRQVQKDSRERII